MSRQLRVLVADDELMARQRLERLAAAAPNVTVVGAARSAEEVIGFLQDEPVDLLLMDIQMPGLSGIEAAALLGEDGPTIIFVTAHAQHAVDAFGVGAVDYILKPVEARRLGQAIARARARLPSAPPQGDPGPLALTTRRGVRLVPTTAISCAVFDGTAVVVHVGDERVFADTTLAALEARLPDPPFIRVHRRGLVNLERVHTLEPVDSGGYIARLDNGAQVAVSRQVARTLRRRLGLR